jgi:manganese transport protein
VKIRQIKPGSTARQLAAAVLAGQGSGGRLQRLLPFFGPAFIASVAYVDPGNFATNIQGGARFGYTLLWVIVASNLMAILVQVLSAKLGIACGQNLAEVCRQELPRPLVWGMWLLMELVAMATDLAEFLGAALGFALLFGMPLWLGGLITALTTFLILGLEVYAGRGPFLGLGRDHGRTSHHAGVSAPAHPHLATPPGDHCRPWRSSPWTSIRPVCWCSVRWC